MKKFALWATLFVLAIALPLLAQVPSGASVILVPGGTCAGCTQYRTLSLGQGLVSVDGGATGTFQLSAVSNIVTKTTAYTLVASDGTIICNGTLTLTLPTTGIPTGQLYRIEESASASTCTVSSSVNINGATSFTLASQYATAAVQWDGTQWWKVQ